MAVVAVLLLPLVAMLAGGSALEDSARNRAAAARIAEEVLVRLERDAGGGAFRLFFGHSSDGAGLALPQPRPGAPSLLHLAFDGEGRFLRVADPAEYSRGLRSSEGAFHLAEVEIAAPESAATAPPGGGGLLSLRIRVEQPASAQTSARSGETFTTRIAPLPE